MSLFWREGVGSIRNERGGRDKRYNRNTLGADPGENDLGGCCSKALRGCKDRFVNWATRVTGNRTNGDLSQCISSEEGLADIRKAAVSFEKNFVFGSELDQLFVLMVVVWVEGDLFQVSPRVFAVARRCLPGLQQG